MTLFIYRVYLIQMKNYIFIFLSFLMYSVRLLACDSEMKSTLSPSSFMQQSPQNETFTINQWDGSSNQIGGLTVFENPESMTIKDFLELTISRTKNESRIFEWSLRDSKGNNVTKNVRLKGDQVFLRLSVNGEELSLVHSLRELSPVVREKEAYKSEHFQSLLLFHNQIFNQYQPEGEYKSRDLLWEALKTNVGRRIATVLVMSAMSTGLFSNAYGNVANAEKSINEIKIEQNGAKVSVSTEKGTYQYTDYEAEDSDIIRDNDPPQKGTVGHLEAMNADELFKHLKNLNFEVAEKAVEVHYNDFRLDPNFKALNPFHQSLVSRFLQNHQSEGVNKARLSSSVLDYQEKGYQISDLEMKAQAATRYDVAFDGAKITSINPEQLNNLSDENEALFKSIVNTNPYVDQQDLLDQLIRIQTQGDQFKEVRISGEGFTLTHGMDSNIQVEGNFLKVSNQEKMEVEFKALYKPNYANPDQKVLQSIMEKGTLNEKESLTLSLHGGADSNSAAMEYQNMERYIQNNVQSVIDGTVDTSKLETFGRDLMQKNYSNVAFTSSQMKNIFKNTLVNMILGSEETMSALAEKGISSEDLKNLDLKDGVNVIDAKLLDITGNAALTSVRIAVLDASFKALGLKNYNVLNHYLANGVEDLHSVIAANENSSSIIQKILIYDGKAQSIDELSNDRILEILKDPLMQVQKSALFSQMRNSGISVTFNQTGVQTVALKTITPQSFEQTFNKPNTDAEVYIDGSHSMNKDDVSIFLNYLDDLGVKSIDTGKFHLFGDRIKVMDFDSNKDTMAKKIIAYTRANPLGDDENHYQLVKKEIGSYLNGTRKAPKTIFIATDEAIQGFSYKKLIDIKNQIDSEHIPLDIKFLIISSNSADASKNYVKSMDLNTMVDLSLQMVFARGTRGYTAQLNPVMKGIADLEAKQGVQALSEAEMKEFNLLKEKFVKISNNRLKIMYKLYDQFKKSGDKISFSDVQMNAAFKFFDDVNIGKDNYKLFHEQYKQVFGLFQKAA